jgi:hypothetical protein
MLTANHVAGSKGSFAALINRTVIIIPLLGVIIAGWITPIQAESTPQPSHRYVFGQDAHFTLQPAPAPVPTEAILFLDVNGRDLESYQGIIGKDKIQHRRDLTAAPFPPFAEITYWWRLESSGDGTRETEPITFRYVDNRYTWHSLRRDELIVHWISGGTDVMASALDIGTQALADLEHALQPPESGELHIYMYPSQSELRSAMQLAGYSWAGGIAYPELNVMLIAIPATDEAVVRMKRTIPHELTHQMLHSRLGTQGYRNLPVWLDEGLATNFEQSPNATYALTLQESQSLIPLEVLCDPFPDDAATARLSYAQSQSLVSYLREVYGWSTVRDLLDVYADGVGCEAGVVRVLGIDLNQLERRWSQWLKDGDTSIEPLNPPAWRETWNRTQNWMDLLIESAGPWLLFVGFLFIPRALTLALSRRN